MKILQWIGVPLALSLSLSSPASPEPGRVPASGVPKAESALEPHPIPAPRLDPDGPGEFPIEWGCHGGTALSCSCEASPGGACDGCGHRRRCIFVGEGIRLSCCTGGPLPPWL